MPTPDVFESDVFSLRSLIAAINDVDYKPGRIGELGYFQASGITTTQVWVEKRGDNLALVEATARGSDPDVVTGARREAIDFATFRLAERATILADSVQGVRAFGDEVATQMLETVRDERLGQLRSRIEVTQEWHRIGAIRGLLRQPDGSTLLDLYEKFDLDQVAVGMELDTEATDVSTKSLDVLEAQEEGLGAYPFTRSRALAGSSFWRKLIKHASVKDTYKNFAQGAAMLQGDRRDAFEFGGIVWERYRGKVNGMAFIPEDQAYVVPEGVAGLFITRYAPADYRETVNTLGLPYYAKEERMKFDRGIEIEAQSNPIHLCTRPQAVIRLYENEIPS